MIATLCGCVSAHAATITVTNTADSGAGTLRAALANAADGDTIDATGVSGTITLSTGQLVVTNSVTIVGPGPGNLAVDGNSVSRVFHIQNAGTVAISSLTVSNGSGGIFNDHSTLTVSNCTLIGNVADSGGGIFNDGSFGSATLTVIASTLILNSAGFGGSLYNNGQPLGNATMTVQNSTISSNGASFGGGIYNDADPGGADSSIATLKISASTLIGNVADSGGGGIVNDGVTGNAILQIANSTFSGNSCFSESPGGGNILNGGPSGGGALEIGNTILKAGAAGVNILNVASSTVTSRGYNLSSDNGSGLLTATGDQINTDPRLDSAGLQDNGGPTLTIALLCGSPALDKGKRDTLAELASDTDQRGLPRPVDDPAIANAAAGDGSDIGAFETQTPPCCFSIDPTNATFNASGGFSNVMVTASATDCVWIASSNDSFLTITAGTNGVGNGTVAYSVAANPNGFPLTGTLTIAGESFTVTQAALVPHDLAIVKLKALKKITLSSTVTTVTRTVTVTIQNRGPNLELISSSQFTNLVDLAVHSLSKGCPDLVATLHVGAPQKVPPFAIKSKGKLNVVFDVTFSTGCVPDSMATSKTEAHNDYQTVATVHAEVIDGNLDTFPGDDTCPRGPLNNVPLGTGTITDKGCGGKNPDGTLGADVFTDVIVK